MRNIDKEGIRDAILDATDNLLARYGYKKMTVDDLAQEVGIGKGTIYLHFSSKEEVVLSHIDRVIDRMRERLTVIARSDASSAERLRLMLIERVLFRFDAVQQYSRSLDDLLSSLRSKLLARRKRYFEEEALIFAEVLKDGKQNGEFDFQDAITTAHTLLMATNSLLPYSLSTRELGERGDVEVKVSHIADLLLSGLLFRKSV